MDLRCPLGTFCPRDVLSPGRFVPWDVCPWDVFVLGRFVCASLPLGVYKLYLTFYPPLGPGGWGEEGDTKKGLGEGEMKMCEHKMVIIMLFIYTCKLQRANANSFQ